MVKVGTSRTKEQNSNHALCAVPGRCIPDQRVTLAT